MNKGVLELKDIKIFARHGCFEEEREIGNWFIVDFSAERDIMTDAMSDSLDDAVNYQIIFDIISEEMEIPSNLLENVAYRILRRVKERFPRINSASVSVAKVNPPLGGQVGASRITLSY
ncbi:MAG: dihydroneopterin aldolase [Candidatus Coprenecus sp.]|nr:dihydroneopterin aldolase [Candidatus Coprenecus sp.]